MKRIVRALLKHLVYQGLHTHAGDPRPVSTKHWYCVLVNKAPKRIAWAIEDTRVALNWWSSKSL